MLWGSNFMVTIVLIHMAQVFLFGAYKFPRELTWDRGRVFCSHDARNGFWPSGTAIRSGCYWGLGIGASIASRVPVVGPWIVNLSVGGADIAGATLSRFFALHVFVIRDCC
jgi:ubiquinol-cytochrome c reductase cytochrome b subunit